MRPTTTLATSKTPAGAELTLTEHDGNYFLNIGGVPLMNTRAYASEQRMAELACESLRGRKPRILIGGLGFGFTLRRTLELVPRGAVVEVAELLPEIVRWNREFLTDVNGACLGDPRVTVRTSDVYELVRNAHSRPYDAVLLDVDNGAAALVDHGNARLYTPRGLKMVLNGLSRGGRAVFWSANRDKEFHRALHSVFGNAEAVGAKAYPQAKRFSHTLFVADRER